ncbi:MAG TPA: 3-hydroxyacyl-CoA dehydrogenase NAD-binding domain-containing protein [Terracidiphilus sp.]|nr:3-hydroxyacyl-CoA dehydrogenase NAD-binding domain-containing protein [Terracidiphilus sp.]
MPTLAIIGAGPLGRWLAGSAARAGYRVLLEDVMPANLHHAQEELRQRLGPAALGTAVTFTSTIEDAVREADLAMDCVPDELESKLEIFCLLDRMAPPKTVLMTPTTQLSITDLAACTYRTERCVAIAAEAASLAQLQPDDTIELRRGTKTDAAALALVEDFWRALGMRPRVEPDPLA